MSDQADADADASLARYLEVLGADLPLVPVFIDGARSPNIFGCEDCATIHFPMWDEALLFADRYVPMTGDRRGCDSCENIPVEHEVR